MKRLLLLTLIEFDLFGATPIKFITKDESYYEVVDRIWTRLDTTGDLSTYTLEELGLFFREARDKGQIMLYHPRGTVKEPKALMTPPRKEAPDHMFSMEDLEKRTRGAKK